MCIVCCPCLGKLICGYAETWTRYAAYISIYTRYTRSLQLMSASAILEPIQLNATLQQATVFNAALGVPLQCSCAGGRLQKETHEGKMGRECEVESSEPAMTDQAKADQAPR